MERERETRREEKEIRLWKEDLMRREVEIDARERDLWLSGVGKGTVFTLQNIVITNYVLQRIANTSAA